MGNKKGIRITYTNGATKTVFESEIKKGRSKDPLLYDHKDSYRNDLVKMVEVGEFKENKPRKHVKGED